MSFENQMVNTLELAHYFIAGPLKITLAYVLIGWFFRIFVHTGGKNVAEVFSSTLFLFFKTIIYGFTAFLVFFFDFNTKTLVIPKEEMLLTTFLVGAFSTYEFIDNLYSLIIEVKTWVYSPRKNFNNRYK